MTGYMMMMAQCKEAGSSSVKHPWHYVCEHCASPITSGSSCIVRTHVCTCVHFIHTWQPSRLTATYECPASLPRSCVNRLHEVGCVWLGRPITRCAHANASWVALLIWILVASPSCPLIRRLGMPKPTGMTIPAVLASTWMCSLTLE